MPGKNILGSCNGPRPRTKYNDLTFTYDLTYTYHRVYTLTSSSPVYVEEYTIDTVMTMPQIVGAYERAIWPYAEYPENPFFLEIECCCLCSPVPNGQPFVNAFKTPAGECQTVTNWIKTHTTSSTRSGVNTLKQTAGTGIFGQQLCRKTAFPDDDIPPGGIGDYDPNSEYGGYLQSQPPGFTFFSESHTGDAYPSGIEPAVPNTRPSVLLIQRGIPYIKFPCSADDTFTGEKTLEISLDVDTSGSFSTIVWHDVSSLVITSTLTVDLS